jgi:hypothetical protein
MVGRINNPNPQPAFWPWPANVKEKLVDRAQLDRKKGKTKAGDARNPPLASAALMEFMGPGHTSEELRLPLPIAPYERDAQTSGGTDQPVVAELMDKASGLNTDSLQRTMARLQVPPARLDQLKSLLGREAAMLGVMSRLGDDMAEIQRRMKDEQKTRGY